MLTKLRCACHEFAALMAFATFAFFSLHQNAVAQGPGSYGAGTLLYSPSASASGIGSGAVAASTEASAMHYNPAALSRLGQVALEGSTFKLIPALTDDARYGYIAGAYRLSSSKEIWLGASYMRAGFGEQTITGEYSPEPLGTFEPYELAIAVAAAIKLDQHAAFGAEFKHIRVNYGPIGLSNANEKGISASAFALDLGLLYEGLLPAAHLSKRFLRAPLPWQSWRPRGLQPGFAFGLALANVGTKLNFIEPAQGDPLPQNLRLGLAWNVFESDLLQIAATGEFMKMLVKVNRGGQADGALQALFTAWGDKHNHAIYSGGVEVGLLQFAALRVGRTWDGRTSIGYNAFGYAIGPPNMRFSFAKYTPYSTGEWRVYSVTVVLDRLL